MKEATEKNRCKLYDLIKSFSECDLSIAGATLYGCACLIECQEETRDFMLADYGIRKTKKLEEDIERMRETLEEESISAYTVRNCLKELLPTLEELYEEENDYAGTEKRYDEHTSLYRIYQDAVNGMDRRMARLFTSSAHAYDIGKYRRMLTNGRISFKEATTGEAFQEITFDRARELLREYGLLDDNKDDTEDDLHNVEYLNQDEINAIFDEVMEEETGKNTDHDDCAAMKKSGVASSGGE